MRISLLVIAALLASPALAIGSPAEDGERVRLLMVDVLAALEAKQPAGLVAAFSDRVQIYGMAFTTKPCRKAFGKSVAVEGKALAKLAACIVAMPARPTPAVAFTVMEQSADWFVMMAGDTALPFLDVTVGPEGPRIHRLTGTEGQLGGDLGADPVLKVGGAVVLRSAPRAAPASQPSPPVAAKVVAPSQLEPLRVAGTQRVDPAPATKAKLARSGKPKVVASFKVCLDETGAITATKPLKSSGVAAYDTDLTTAIAGWRFSPYVVDGKPITVCTAYTFVYKP